MINLLRMDLYRLRRSKSVYICLGILMAGTILTFCLMFLLATPQGQKTSMKIGMLHAYEIEEAQSMLSGTNSLGMFRESFMDGGMYGCILGILITLFTCGDFHNGFIKNTMSLHRARWKYIASKLAAAGILNFLFLVITLLFNNLVNLLFHNMVPFAALTDTLYYLSLAWLINTAFSSLVILICILTHSQAAGVTVSLLLCGGIVQTILAQVTSLLHIDGWIKYTLYYNMCTIPSSYSGIRDLKGLVLGLLFLIIYSGAAAFFITRQDI